MHRITFPDQQFYFNSVGTFTPMQSRTRMNCKPVDTYVSACVSIQPGGIRRPAWLRSTIRADVGLDFQS